MTKIQVHTFGCKVNSYDSGLLETQFKDFKGADSLSSNLQSAARQIHVINSCAVTAEASREAKKLAVKIKAKDPTATVVVTGCAAQVDKELFSDAPAIDLVVANSHKGQLSQLIASYLRGESEQKVYHSNIFKKDDLEAGGGLEPGHTRSFLKIQDGCNSFCSFCVIPYARGKSRSIPVADLLTQINFLVDKGIKELVLTGVHIGDYHDEVNNSSLEDLVESILLKTKVYRIRLTSLEPIELSPRLLEMYSDSRLCPHFHLSIQSASSKVLRDMKRKYDQHAVIDTLEAIHQRFPQAFVGMDVIAGFPTETHEDFMETHEVLARTPWTRLHVFPYSERKGTKAASLPESVEMAERKQRAWMLRNLSWHRYQQQIQSQVGSIKKVLILNQPSKGAEGISRDFWNIKLSSDVSGYRGREILVKVNQIWKVDSQRMDGVLAADVLEGAV